MRVDAVVDGKTFCIHCLPEDLHERDSDDEFIVLVDTDDWLAAVGPCVKCGEYITEVVP